MQPHASITFEDVYPMSNLHCIRRSLTGVMSLNIKLLPLDVFAKDVAYKTLNPKNPPVQWPIGRMSNLGVGDCGLKPLSSLVPTSFRLTYPHVMVHLRSEVSVYHYMS